MAWLVEQCRGPAEEFFHGLDEPPVPTIRALMVSAPTIVLGSSQDRSVVVRDVGADVVQRRSGGSAVWLDDDLIWLDVSVPTGDPAWHADIHRTAVGIGDRLARVIGHDAVVHRGPMVSSPLSGLVCFSGLGPGEVTVAGRKVIGVAQRRTRTRTLIQIGVLLRWDPGRLLDALGVDDEEMRARARSAARGLLDGPGEDTAAARRVVLEAVLAAVPPPSRTAG
jgi:lipoate-protein ligase A